jgi:hypothetical protein
VFTARYGLIPYMKHVTFRLLKVKGFPFLAESNDFCYKWQYIVLEGNYFCWMCLWFGRRVASSSGPKKGAVLADRLLKGIWKN